MGRSERDFGSKAGPYDDTFELSVSNSTREMAGDVARALLPVPLHAILPRDEVAVDVDPVGVAFTDQRLFQPLAAVRDRIGDDASDILALTVRVDYPPGATPAARKPGKRSFWRSSQDQRPKQGNERDASDDAKTVLEPPRY
jgi:hypothetical protein